MLSNQAGAHHALVTAWALPVFAMAVEALQIVISSLPTLHPCSFDWIWMVSCHWSQAKQSIHAAYQSVDFEQNMSRLSWLRRSRAHTLWG